MLDLIIHSIRIMMVPVYVQSALMSQYCPIYTFVAKPIKLITEFKLISNRVICKYCFIILCKLWLHTYVCLTFTMEVSSSWSLSRGSKCSSSSRSISSLLPVLNAVPNGVSPYKFLTVWINDDNKMTSRENLNQCYICMHWH